MKEKAWYTLLAQVQSLWYPSCRDHWQGINGASIRARILSFGCALFRPQTFCQHGNNKWWAERIQGTQHILSIRWYPVPHIFLGHPVHVQAQALLRAWERERNQSHSHNSMHQQYLDLTICFWYLLQWSFSLFKVRHWGNLISYQRCIYKATNKRVISYPFSQLFFFSTNKKTHQTGLHDPLMKCLPLP